MSFADFVLRLLHGFRLDFLSRSIQHNERPHPAGSGSWRDLPGTVTRPGFAGNLLSRCLTSEFAAAQRRGTLAVAHPGGGEESGRTVLQPQAHEDAVGVFLVRTEWPRIFEAAAAV